MLRLVIFGSGRGSNFMAIVDAIEEGVLPAKIVKVIVNEPDAPMLDKAKNNYIDSILLPHHQLTKEEHEKAILRELELIDYDLICLAGYMRILSADFIKTVETPIINIHPSLLPAFKGLEAQQQALDYGVKVTGCTVHVVNEEVDSGKILDQTAVRVKPNDTVESLSARILVEEHELYPKVIFDIAMGNIQLE